MKQKYQIILDVEIENTDQVEEFTKEQIDAFVAAVHIDSGTNVNVQKVSWKENFQTTNPLDFSKGC